MDTQSNFNLSFSTGSYLTFNGELNTPLITPKQTVIHSEVRDYFRQAANKPSSSDDTANFPDSLDQWVINQAIESAFSMVPHNGLIQFWAPEYNNSGLVLTTRGRPYKLESQLKEHRLSTQEYQYNITIAADELEVINNPKIISGAPGNAFISCLAEIVPNMRVHKKSPLVLSALNYEIMCYFVLPICSPYESKCVGVVECCTKEFDCLLKIFCHLVNALKVNALKTYGLSTFQGESLLCKTNDGLYKMVEIEEALKTACISHELTFAQVSIAHEDSNDVPHSSSLEGKHMKRLRALKMIGLWPDSQDYDFKDYCGICDMLPLNIGEGLAGKALQNYEIHFCGNIYELENKLPVFIKPAPDKKRSCLVICLKHINTDVDYVFEFLWLQNRKHIVLMIESIILTLKRCLPNFKLASTEELGDELRVVEVRESISKDEMGSFGIFKGAKLSTVPEIFEKERILVAEQCTSPSQVNGNTRQQALSAEAIKQQYGKTQERAAEYLHVSLSHLKRKRIEFGLGNWKGPKDVKRKVSRSCKDQSDTNEEDNREILGPLTIKAVHGDDIIKLPLPPLRQKFKAVEKEICKQFDLNLGSFKLKYLDDEKEMILLRSDEHMRDFIKSSRSQDCTTIKLYVQPI